MDRRKCDLDFLIRVKDSRTSWKTIQQLPMGELDTDVITTVTTTQRNSDKAAGHVFLQTHAKDEKEYSPRTRAGNIYKYEVNFKEAVGQCRKYLKGEDITGGELLEKIARHTVPIRPSRADQRKLRPKGFVGFTYRVAA